MFKIFCIFCILYFNFQIELMYCFVKDVVIKFIVLDL